MVHNIHITKLSHHRDTGSLITLWNMYNQFQLFPFIQRHTGSYTKYTGLEQIIVYTQNTNRLSKISVISELYHKHTTHSSNLSASRLLSWCWGCAFKPFHREHEGKQSCNLQAEAFIRFIIWVCFNSFHLRETIVCWQWSQFPQECWFSSV